MADKNKDPQAAEGYTPPDDSEALEQGFRGTKIDPRPNEEYSLETGPESPSALEQNADALRAQADAVEASGAEAADTSSSSSSAKGDDK